MIEALIAWDDEDDPDGNIQHIADNDITPEEVMDVLRNVNNEELASRSSGRPITVGRTPTGRLVAVVWEIISDEPLVIHPVTAFEIE
jgi:hypothetical protein